MIITGQGSLRAGDDHHRAGQLARVIPGEVRDKGPGAAARCGTEDQRSHFLALTDELADDLHGLAAADHD